MVDPFKLTIDSPLTLPPPFDPPRLIAGTILALPNDSLPVLPFLDEFTCVTYMDLHRVSQGLHPGAHDSRAWRALGPTVITLSRGIQRQWTLRHLATHLFRHRFPYALDLSRPARITCYILPSSRQLARISVLGKLL